MSLMLSGDMTRLDGFCFERNIDKFSFIALVETIWQHVSILLAVGSGM